MSNKGDETITPLELAGFDLGWWCKHHPSSRCHSLPPRGALRRGWRKFCRPASLQSHGYLVAFAVAPASHSNGCRIPPPGVRWRSSGPHRPVWTRCFGSRPRFCPKWKLWAKSWISSARVSQSVTRRKHSLDKFHVAQNLIESLKIIMFWWIKQSKSTYWDNILIREIGEEKKSISKYCSKFCWIFGR